MISYMSKSVFDEGEELFMVEVAVNQEHLVVLQNLPPHPIWHEGVDALVRNQLILLAI